MTKYKRMLLPLLLLNSSLATANEPESKSLQTDEVTPSVTLTYNDPRDPFEGFNRAMWDLNYLYFDKYLFRPVAHGYNDYIPRPVKLGLIILCVILKNLVRWSIMLFRVNGDGLLMQVDVLPLIVLWGFLELLMLLK